MANPSRPTDKAEAILTPEECRAARKALGWTLLRLAVAADVSPTATWLFESRRRSPFPRTLTALRMALEGGGYEFLDSLDNQMRPLAAEIELLHAKASVIADADEAKKIFDARNRLVRQMWREPATTRAGKAAKVKIAVLLLGWRGPSEDLPLTHDLARRLFGELAGLTEDELEEM